MPPVELTWGAATAVGQREDNQDRYLAAPPVFAVADGMGGHVGGAAAAEAVVEALRSLTGGETTTVEAIRLALQRADGEIRAFQGPDKAGAGTTVAGVALVDEGNGPQWAVFHVGDSRVYRWHEGRLDQLTTDHSVVQELLDAGYISDASAATHPQRHIITRALGVGPRPEADVVLLPVMAGERFLACSDGLTGELSDAQIAALVGAGNDVEKTVARLTSEAESAGARDNVTVVAVQVGHPGTSTGATAPR
ncbi:PP2C family protein-serine/threonine phosphatase [Geodermatophilus obscurus]|uniref:Protein serine/threonine phosphatase n=1 Tax=Geodermatophilus obscurus (strain ATCC 25078 / DSM 43160 / JCM 3152 / CCUG 61914 / KCC A-0152 / KCTC 9177 / NBRC 13315 / NRRL B-3577 / G-20) TaxID=526225 RepID=D2S565_GEOOG|nr:protein phosphatase 2C domain-containing protein [Geodermatophilus obscurus]ADB73176.1 protein serine/threonine phosphatase [Geodermatophilus obscurus DSM 43160]